MPKTIEVTSTVAAQIGLNNKLLDYFKTKRFETKTQENLINDLNIYVHQHPDDLAHNIKCEVDEMLDGRGKMGRRFKETETRLERTGYIPDDAVKNMIFELWNNFAVLPQDEQANHIRMLLSWVEGVSEEYPQFPSKE